MRIINKFSWGMISVALILLVVGCQKSPEVAKQYQGNIIIKKFLETSIKRIVYFRENQEMAIGFITNEITWLDNKTGCTHDGTFKFIIPGYPQLESRGLLKYQTDSPNNIWPFILQTIPGKLFDAIEITAKNEFVSLQPDSSIKGDLIISFATTIADRNSPTGMNINIDKYEGYLQLLPVNKN